VPVAVNTVVCAPDCGWRYHPKHVERLQNYNKIYVVASRWTIIDIKYK